MYLWKRKSCFCHKQLCDLNPNWKQTLSSPGAVTYCYSESPPLSRDAEGLAARNTALRELRQSWGHPHTVGGAFKGRAACLGLSVGHLTTRSLSTILLKEGTKAPNLSLAEVSRQTCSTKVQVRCDVSVKGTGSHRACWSTSSPFRTVTLRAQRPTESSVVYIPSLAGHQISPGEWTLKVRGKGDTWVHDDWS